MATQYAALHLQRGAGNEAGMSCHIERCTADGKKYVPTNADESRTHLNRELIKFPDGVESRTQAIQHRLKNAGLKRKISGKQLKAIRVVMSGTHEQMMRIYESGKLDAWIDANLKWLNDTFGQDNVVSCVLHMDEKTPHLHATVVPIVTTPRKRRAREGEKKYKEKDPAPRLCADEVMSRSALARYQDTYAAAMKPFGLERGIAGSAARHHSQMEYRRQQLVDIQDNIEAVMAEIETLTAERDQLKKDAGTGVDRVKAWFGKGHLAELDKAMKAKDKEITQLKSDLEAEKKAHTQTKTNAQSAINQLRTGLKNKIDEATKPLNEAIAAKDAEIAEFKTQLATLLEKQKELQDKLAQGAIPYQREVDKANRWATEWKEKYINSTDRYWQLHEQLYPERHRLSSGATLLSWGFGFGTQTSLKIDTLFQGNKFHGVTFCVPDALIARYRNFEITPAEMINDQFTPWEQVDESQHPLLHTMLMTAAGGLSQSPSGGGGDLFRPPVARHRPLSYQTSEKMMFIPIQ